MTRRRAVCLGLAAAALLAACASTPPFPHSAFDSPPVWTITEEPQSHLGREVLWGGMILEIKHHTRYTEIEMLGFPLDRRQQPQAELADEGRFILVVAGFLDPADYAPGRFLTIPGRITGSREGRLRGEAYRWPTLDTLDPYLWPRDFRESNVRWSVGVGIQR